ncbi:hypothetical protein UFOVP75_92 [uncultured Caudovirales phage]|uniref:Uncharacterized protein n=1 Tax=uncultured Caudovirales phage TaxID=2100421 RepID=A0A6J5L5R4_9CAUD|nr:hypothetical protein UFOVP75_92 [uncultured Caudovirales phage]
MTTVGRPHSFASVTGTFYPSTISGKVENDVAPCLLAESGSAFEVAPSTDRWVDLAGLQVEFELLEGTAMVQVHASTLDAVRRGCQGLKLFNLSASILKTVTL